MAGGLGAALEAPDAPFVLAATIFVDPVFRGTRLSDQGPDSAPPWVRRAIRVHDARQLPEPATLDREGFCLIASGPGTGSRPGAKLDRGDDGFARARFYEECVEMVSAATGCLSALVLEHRFRGSPETGRPHAEPYSRIVHADLSPYVEDVVTAARGRHFAIFNVWRSVDAVHPVEFMPLAVCDGQTVDPAGIVYSDGRRMPEGHARFVDLRLIHDPAQRWYYFPRMTADEALVFVQYDTRQEEANRRATFHTAFADPTASPEAPRRASVEARVLAIFRERDRDPADRRARFEAEVPTRSLDGSVSLVRHAPMVDWNPQT